MSEHMPEIAGQAGRDDAPARLNPQRLTPVAAAKLLAQVGAQGVTEAAIRADLEAGAPANADGTINLVHYAAWLVRAMAEGTEALHGP